MKTLDQLLGELSEGERARVERRARNLIALERGGQSMGELELAEKVSGEAYQIIGALASEANLFEHPAVVRALDYFGYEQWREPEAEILPWYVGKDLTP